MDEKRTASGGAGGRMTTPEPSAAGSNGCVPNAV